MYCEPTYGGAPGRPLGLGIFGLKPSTQQSRWERFKAIQEGQREQTDGGVIIRPLGKASRAAASAPPEPLTSQPADAVSFVEPVETYTPPTYTGEPLFAWPAMPGAGPAAPGGGGGAPVSVTVTAPEAPAAQEQEGRGFGMVEAGLGALVALLLARAWQSR